MSLLTDLAGETLDWMARAPRGDREDCSDVVYATALATYVDGTAITPLGHDVTEVLR